MPEFGEPMDLDELIDFADIDPVDIASAQEFWDENASPDFVGILD